MVSISDQSSQPSTDEYSYIEKKNVNKKSLFIKSDDTPKAGPCGSNLFYNKKEQCLIINQNGSIDEEAEKGTITVVSC